MKKFESLFRLDSIRVFKLFEIVYYTIISFIISLFIGNILEDDKIVPYIFKTYDYEEVSIPKLLIDLLIDIVIFVIILYYIKKALHYIPFIFAPLNKKYKPSLKGEVDRGIQLGSGLILFTALSTIKNKIEALNKKIKKII